MIRMMMMRLEPPDKRPRGSPKKRFMDVLKEDTKLVGVKEDNAEEDRVRWRQRICCGDPKGKGDSVTVWHLICFVLLQDD